MTVDPRLAHLVGRCGSCKYWGTWQPGIGHCELEREPDAPIRSVEGSVETRIDFSCAWWQPAEGFDEFGSERTLAAVAELKAQLRASLYDEEPAGDLYANGDDPNWEVGARGVTPEPTSTAQAIIFGAGDTWLIRGEIPTDHPEALVCFESGKLVEWATEVFDELGAIPGDRTRLLADLNLIRHHPEGLS